MSAVTAYVGLAQSQSKRAALSWTADCAKNFTRDEDIAFRYELDGLHSELVGAAVDFIGDSHLRKYRNAKNVNVDFGGASDAWTRYKKLAGRPAAHSLVICPAKRSCPDISSTKPAKLLSSSLWNFECPVSLLLLSRGCVYLVSFPTVHVHTSAELQYL